jgi:hypothetical protein
MNRVFVVVPASVANHERLVEDVNVVVQPVSFATDTKSWRQEYAAARMLNMLVFILITPMLIVTHSRRWAGTTHNNFCEQPVW